MNEAMQRPIDRWFHNYSGDHRNETNQLIHVIAVPAILWSVVALGYGVAFYFLSLVLKTVPVGVAYAIWSGAGIVLIAGIGWLVLKQPLDAPALLGISLIVVGVAVIQLFSKSTVH